MNTVRASAAAGCDASCIQGAPKSIPLQSLVDNSSMV